MAGAVLAADGSGFFWNIDANVGRNCPNKPEDVELVRFGYWSMGQLPTTPAEVKRVIAAMGTSGGYGPDLQAAIDAHQKARGGTQDGHVSRVPTGTVSTMYDGSHSFILLALNWAIRAADTAMWPRLDKAPRSGMQITARSKRVFNV